MTVRQITTSTLAALAAASGDTDAIAAAALAETAHYDKLANMGANVVGDWDFRASRCRVPIALNAEVPNLVRGGSPAVYDRVSGMSLTPNALRLVGAALASTPRLRLPLDVAPEAGLKQYGILIGFTVVAAAGGTASHGLMHFSAQTTGVSMTLVNGSQLMTNRIDNASYSGTFGDEDDISSVYPVVSTPSTWAVGTPTVAGIGYYNGGTAANASRRMSMKDTFYGQTAYTNDGVMSDEAVGGAVYIGENGTHSNLNCTLDIHRVTVVKWLTANGEPPQTFLDIARQNERLYGPGIRAGYTP